MLFVFGLIIYSTVGVDASGVTLGTAPFCLPV
jgi:hypothetical protein